MTFDLFTARSSLLPYAFVWEKCWEFQTTSPLDPLGQCCSIFMWSLLGAGEWKIANIVAVHWPRWPPCPLLRPSTPTFDYLPWQITHSLYRYIFNLWQLRQRVDSDSVVRALEFYPDRPGSNPTISGKFFQLCFVPLLRLSCRKMGARPGSDFTKPKLLRVIINDDFLEKGECYGLALLPSIICLGRLRIACRYIFNLWQLRQGVNSLAQWLEHWICIRTDRVRIPQKAGICFSYASFLCCDFHVVRPYMVKTFKNPLLQNRGCLVAESLHKLSGTGGLPK